MGAEDIIWWISALGNNYANRNDSDGNWIQHWAALAAIYPFLATNFWPGVPISKQTVFLNPKVRNHAVNSRISLTFCTSQQLVFSRTLTKPSQRP
jgi:hypothetical protein